MTLLPTPVPPEVTFQGPRLRAARIQRDLTVEELARRADLTTHHVYQLERGVHAGPRSTTLARLAQILHVSTDYLLGLTDRPAPPEAPHA